MSLLRLLTAGKSLVGLESGEKPYRVGHKGLLPVFERKPNPFRATTRPENGPGNVAAPQSEPALPLGDEVPVDPMKTTQKLPPGQVLPRAALPVAESEPAQGADAAGRGTVGRVLSKVRGALAGRKAGSRKPPPAKGEVLVQPELSLEAVKPMRNDLRDSDLELVPVSRVGSDSVAKFKNVRQLPEVPHRGARSPLSGAGRR